MALEFAKLTTILANDPGTSSAIIIPEGPGSAILDEERSDILWFRLVDRIVVRTWRPEWCIAFVRIGRIAGPENRHRRAEQALPDVRAPMRIRGVELPRVIFHN
jgi:hypothetical protein